MFPYYLIQCQIEAIESFNLFKNIFFYLLVIEKYDH